MKLTGKYRITVTGDTSLLGGGQSVEGIGHLFQRLLCGEDAVMENLANLGIEVRLVDTRLHGWGDDIPEEFRPARMKVSTQEEG